MKLIFVAVFLSFLFDSGDSAKFRHSDWAEEMLLLVNSARREARKRPVCLSDSLSIAARSHAIDMAKHGFLHDLGTDGSTPEDRARTAGFSFTELKENLAYSTSVRKAHSTLLNSPPHYENLLGPDLLFFGFGAAELLDQPGWFYFVELFASSTHETCDDFENY